MVAERIALDDQSLLASLRDADQALKNEQWDDAHRKYAVLYNTAEDNANIHAGLGFCAYKLENPYDAARHFADACLRDAQPHWMMFHIDCLLRIGFPIAANVLSACLLKRHPEMEQQLTVNGVAGRAEQSLSQELGTASATFLDQEPDKSEPAQRATAEIARLLVGHQPREAMELGQTLSKKFPNATGVLLNLGLAHKRLGNFVDSRQAYLRALVIDPTDESLCANLGNLLLDSGSVADAMRFLEASAIGNSESSLIWSNLAASYNHLGVMPTEAEFAARKSLQLSNADHKVMLNTHRLLGSALSRQGRGSEALEQFHQGVDPTDETSFTAPLITMIMDDGTPAKDVTAAHKKYGETLDATISEKVARNRRSSDPKLFTFGFISADFRNHSVSYFALPLIEHLNRLGHSIVAYFNFGVEDSVSSQYKPHVRHWRSVRGLPDEDVVQMIIRDEIDVLIDLAGHTAGHRLPVFMKSPAALNVTWLGHPATTGIRAMDARITDWVSDPVGEEQHYTEHVLRLPEIFCAYRPLVRDPSLRFSEAYLPQDPPAERGGFITFGSCNTLGKYSDTTISMWAAVLTAVPNSKLLIEAPGLQAIALQRNISNRFSKFNISPDRLILKARDPKKQYLIYNEIDVALDCFPCNGGTTTFDVLWMGLPLVTRRGDRFASRMGAAVLSALGREEWIADTKSDFVRIAKDLSQDVSRLAAMRASQRAEMEASPLMQEEKFAHAFVEGVRRAWREIK